jgi:ABC-2 type transport system permease protein
MHLSTNLIWIAVAVLVIVRIGWRLKNRSTAGKSSSAAKPRRRLIKSRRYVAFRGLTIASMKMYFRNRTALFFSLFFPIVFIGIFGFIFKNSSASFKIDLSNQSQTELSQQFTTAVGNVPAFKIKHVSEAQGATDLDKNNADLVVIIPPDFGQTAHGRLVPSQVVAHFNKANPQNGQAAAQIIQQLGGSFNDSISRQPKVITLDASGVATKNLSYIDFLLPGMVGLSIMQLGIFSVAFGFVSYKTTGALRRLQATPVHPSDFLTAQAITRLIVAILQTILLAGMGIALFGFHLAPSSWVPFLVLALLGSAVFQAFGFAIAGWAKNEDQAQPVAQLIQFPMMFLSGTFFPRDGFPHLLQIITAYLPLTFLTDALRQVANNSATLWGVRTDLLGLIIWGVVAGAVAVRVFSWE